MGLEVICKQLRKPKTSQIKKRNWFDKKYYEHFINMNDNFLNPKGLTIDSILRESELGTASLEIEQSSRNE